ncbi:putative aminotransferase [Gordonia phage GTE2]|uniref:Putative aminotransferase n=1 Tax=Gordonia phage GTE2 TaxID=981323 RepID=F8S0W5_9CAUD|nr:putative aminotransferase [Gordonia phage GTE2]ADX42640.1 putative aminotransferase [Gordonia phage GTE2]
MPTMNCLRSSAVASGSGPVFCASWFPILDPPQLVTCFPNLTIWAALQDRERNGHPLHTTEQPSSLSFRHICRTLDPLPQLTSFVLHRLNALPRRDEPAVVCGAVSGRLRALQTPWFASPTHNYVTALVERVRPAQGSL